MGCGDVPQMGLSLNPEDVMVFYILLLDFVSKKKNAENDR